MSKEKTPELLPCPFCGGDAACIPLAVCHGYIACVGKCGIRTGDYWDDMSVHNDNPEKWYEKAIEAWNRRVHEIN